MKPQGTEETSTDWPASLTSTEWISLEDYVRKMGRDPKDKAALEEASPNGRKMYVQIELLEKQVQAVHDRNCLSSKDYEDRRHEHH